MDATKAEKQKLARRILDLERKIVAWNASSDIPKETYQQWRNELKAARDALPKVIKSSLDIRE